MSKLPRSKMAAWMLAAAALFLTPRPIIVAAPAAAAVATPSRAEELRAVLFDASSSRVLVAAHRGDWRGFPENSLKGIESAIRMGADIVEVDLARTKDGAFILMHDRTLDRTTNGKGKVSEHTLAEIRTLRLRNGCAILTPYPVPTLEEALAVVKGRVLLNIDKGYEWQAEVLPILEQTGTARQVVIKGYGQPAEEILGHPDLLARTVFMPIITFKKLEDDGKVAAIAQGHVERIKPAAMEIVLPEWTAAVERTYAACRAHGIRIWANTLWSGMSGPLSDDAALENPDAHYGWLLRHGVTIIQSDRPEFLISYLRQQGRHP